jgi:aminotransferase
MIKISECAEKIQPSLTRRLFDMAKKYTDVIDFTLGDPDLSPHDNIKQAACSAINKGLTRYSQNAGLLELRKSISRYHLISDGLDFDAQKQIIVTVGAMEGLFLAFISILNPGDEVIIPAPYWVNYQQMVLLCHAIPVIVDSGEEGDLSISIDAIKKAITSNTKAIIINSPNNPSGLMIEQEKIAKIAEIAISRNLIVISDEVYKTLIYDNRVFKSIVHCQGMRERTILVNSFSKQFCMTGWRIGYVLAPEELIATMTKLQENIVACAPLPSQYAAIEALNSVPDNSSFILSEFNKRRNFIVEKINKIKCVSCGKPEATFYLMLNIKKTGLFSEEFAYKLLEQVHVAVVPGITYGKNCEGYVRIAFTLPIDKIMEGIKRLEIFMNRLII